MNELLIDIVSVTYNFMLKFCKGILYNHKQTRAENQFTTITNYCLITVYKSISVLRVKTCLAAYFYTIWDMDMRIKYAIPSFELFN